MGWLSKLIVIDNLGSPKYKRNSNEFFGRLKKNYPQTKRICWDLLTLIKSYSWVCYRVNLWNRSGFNNCASRALTYDVSMKQNFLMNATLMWTINNFSGYRIVSSWSTHGKLACIHCMKNNKAFTLTNNGKTPFFYCHWQFLPTNHKYLKNKKDFFIDRVEKNIAPPYLLGEELYDMMLEYGDSMFDFQYGKHKFLGFGLTYNWVKRSIFWELSYWKTNLFLHNLDIIHI